MKNIRYQFQRWLAPVLFSIAVAVMPLRADDTMALPAQSVPAGHLHYLAAGEPDVIALLAPPPLPDSAEQAADMEEVRAVYHAASSNDIAIAYSQKKFTIFTFTPAIGAFFVPEKFPKTEAFFQRVQADAEAVTDNAKDYYKRPRPYVSIPASPTANWKKVSAIPAAIRPNPWCWRSCSPICFPTSTTPSSPRRVASAGIALKLPGIIRRTSMPDAYLRKPSSGR